MDKKIIEVKLPNNVIVSLHRDQEDQCVLFVGEKIGAIVEPDDKMRIAQLMHFMDLVTYEAKR